MVIHVERTKIIQRTSAEWRMKHFCRVCQSTQCFICVFHVLTIEPMAICTTIRKTSLIPTMNHISLIPALNSMDCIRIERPNVIVCSTPSAQNFFIRCYVVVLHCTTEEFFRLFTIFKSTISKTKQHPFKLRTVKYVSVP